MARRATEILVYETESYDGGFDDVDLQWSMRLFFNNGSALPLNNGPTARPLQHFAILGGFEGGLLGGKKDLWMSTGAWER